MTPGTPEAYARAVQGVLARHGPLSTGALYERHTRMPHMALYAALRDLTERGVVTCDRIPHANGTLEARWRLTDARL